MAMIKISPPWYSFYKELKCLLGDDKDINIVFDEQKMEIFLYVQKVRTAAALTTFLPTKKIFGKVELKITVVPTNDISKVKNVRFEDIFLNNPHVYKILRAENFFYSSLVYIIFNYEIAQYFNDNLSDAYGCCSKLYQDIAREIFDSKVPIGTFFSTEISGENQEIKTHI